MARAKPAARPHDAFVTALLDAGFAIGTARTFTIDKKAVARGSGRA
jgi:hypothetical protein